MFKSLITDKFIFDVDGTLTPSRSCIDPVFKLWFTEFCKRNSVYIVTGSDREKTIEQIGNDILNLCVRVYQCSGNDVWENNKNIRVNNIQLNDDMSSFFRQCMMDSNFKTRTGRHVEVRPGLINFSVVGRGANKDEREQYVKYDTINSERYTIAQQFNERFGPDYIAQVAGETGIDIMVSGKDKSQIIKDFSETDNLHFFGDKTFMGGNDYTLASEIINQGGTVYRVKDWRETWETLQRM